MKKLFLLVLLSSIISCQKPKLKTMINAIADSSSFDIYFNQKIRIKDIVFSQKSDFKSFINQENGILGVGYSNDAKLYSKVISEKNTILLSVFSSERIKDSDQSLSIDFGDLPDFKIGNAAFKYGTVKAWTHPVIFTSLDSLKEKDNQFVIFQYADGIYGVIVPLIDQGFVSTIGKNAEGKMSIKSNNLMPSIPDAEIKMAVVAFDANPYKAIENAYNEAFKEMKLENSLRKNKKYPDFFEKTMWCTWNSFGHTLNEKQVIDGMEKFKANGVTIPLLLLDDGWSVVSNYGTGTLNGFGVEKTKFPNGLKATIDTVKQKYGVKYVGVWHAFSGYWGGIDSSAVDFQGFSNDFLKYQDKIGWLDVPKSTFVFVNPFGEKGKDFYRTWHKQLKNEGVDFLKVDNQLVLDRMSKNNFPFGDFAKQMEYNLQSSIQEHFAGNVVNCMDMTTDAAYHFGNSAIARSSEDFFPENDSYKITAGNAAIHVLCNVHNALWWSQLAYPDYDMFQTYHSSAEYHAIARAISGGPIYITDNPEKSDLNILNKIIYRDGTIIRSDVPALPTQDCIFNVMDDQKPLKAFSKSNGVYLVAAFNTSQKGSVKGDITLSDIPDLKKSTFILFDYKNQKFEILNASSKYSFELEKLKSNLFYLFEKQDFVALGLLEKYNAPKTILNQVIEKNKVKLSFYEGGNFVAYSTKTPKQITNAKGESLKFTFSNQLLIVENGDKNIEITF